MRYFVYIPRNVFQQEQKIKQFVILFELSMQKQLKSFYVAIYKKNEKKNVEPLKER